GRSSLSPPLAVDLFASDERGLKCRKVDFVTVNLRLNTADELASELLIPSRVANLDKSLPLPVVGHLRVIVECARQIDRQFTFISLGPQPQIDAKHRAFRCRPGKNFRCLLCESDEIFAIRNARRRRLGTIAE